MKALLAVDGSPCSERAAETLMRQYKPNDTEVFVLHVVDCPKLSPIPYTFGPGPVFAEDYTKITKQWRHEGEQLVAELSKRFAAATSRVEDGDALELILEYAR